MRRSLWVAATAQTVLLVGCGGAESDGVATEPTATATLDCGDDEFRHNGELDYGDEPAPEGEPVEVVSEWLAHREGEFREALREVPHDEHGAYLVAVEQEDRVVALVEVRDWPPGGRIVDSFEACLGFSAP